MDETIEKDYATAEEWGVSLLTTSVDSLMRPYYSPSPDVSPGSGKSILVWEIAPHVNSTHREENSMDFLRRFFGSKQSVNLPSSDLEKALTGLGNKDPEVRQDAVVGLGQLGGEEAIDALLGALKDEDPGTQAEAALALGKIGGRRAIEALRQVVANEGSERSGGWVPALLAMAKNRDTTVLEPAVRVLSNRANEWDIRTMAARALGDLGDPEALDALRDAAADSNDSVRVQAETSLTNLEPMDNVEDLACFSCLHRNPIDARECANCGKSLLASWER